MLGRLRMAALILIFLPIPGLPTTWTVFEDGSGGALTIQAALDSVGSGDSILVYPGIYSERLVRDNLEDISIVGVSGRDETRIDMSGGRSVLSIDYLMLSGLWFYGGEGIEVSGDRFSITDCKFSAFSSATNENIRLQGEGSSGYSLFEDNSVIGLNSEAGSNLLIDNVIMRGNVVKSNLAIDAYYGQAGNINIYGQGAVLEQNLFQGNSAPNSGTIEFDVGAVTNDLNIKNNIFYRNYSLWLLDIPTLISITVSNNVFYNNQSERALRRELSSPPTCNIFYLTEYSRVQFPEEFWNWETDPSFCDPTGGEFTVNVESFCLPENHLQGVNCGLIGIYGAGCPTALRKTTWGFLKLSRHGR